MKTIPLTNGGETMVDDADYKWLSQYAWRTDDAGYVVRRQRIGKGQSRTVWMHREVLGLGLHLHSDHWDNNRLNNQRSNLRVASARQNAGNQKLRSDNRTGYKGVGSSGSKTKPFKAGIYDHGTYINLGFYACPIEAARAYDAAAREVFGSFGRFNFPLSGEYGCRAD